MNITVAELKQLIADSKDIVVLDVREEWEYNEGKIEGARHFSLYQIPERMDELEDIKEREIIVHCKSGVRSKKAQILLQQGGFKSVINLLGGFDAFKMS